jgi:hypothetical protein
LNLYGAGATNVKGRDPMSAGRGRPMLISLTAIYVAGTVALIMAGIMAAAVQD